MDIRVAIQGTSSTYSARWIEYCRENQIDHEVVDCYDSGIIAKLKDFDAVLWSFKHKSATDLLMARHVFTAAEQMGLAVFPDHKTCWHFDDKIAQKYLLEAVDAPICPSYVFYDKETALTWLKTAEYPLVRKLRRGAGSYNVGLVHSFAEAKKYCARAFGKGFPALPASVLGDALTIRKKQGFGALWRKIRSARSVLARRRKQRGMMQREKGYVLFQKFMPDNSYDTRITVVGDRAWGFIRGVRKNDFRASGSGVIDYDLANVDMECVRIAFATTRAIDAQSVCYDFVKDVEGKPWIVEISYGYVPEAIYACKGLWDERLNWHDGQMWPEHAILEDLIEAVRKRKASA